MPDDVTQQQGGSPPPGDNGGGDGTTPPAPVQQAGAGGGAAPQGDGQPTNTGGSRVQVVPHDAFKRIKQEEFTRGKTVAMEELARSAGFESPADLAGALAKLRNPPAPVQQQATTPEPTQQQGGVTPEELARQKDDRRAEARFQRQLEATLNERNRYAADAKKWATQAQQAREEVDAVRAEMHLRTVAASEGVQDIDYAITLFSREVEKLTPEQAEKFDEKAYFKGLRASKPLLFGETVVPANTGTGTAGAPPPKPGQVTQQNGANGKVDAKKLDPRAYNELLSRRGIVPGM